jgi:hypothetical protein
MAIFTLIVQNDVPFQRLGTATSDLTSDPPDRHVGRADDGLHALPRQPDLGLDSVVDHRVGRCARPRPGTDLLLRRPSTPTSSPPSGARWQGRWLNVPAGAQGAVRRRASTRPSPWPSPTRCGSASWLPAVSLVAVLVAKGEAVASPFPRRTSHSSRAPQSGSGAGSRRRRVASLPSQQTVGRGQPHSRLAPWPTPADTSTMRVSNGSNAVERRAR